jgi:hypothetical protein
MELHQQDFATLGAAEQQAVREDDAEERFISYAFLRQSGTQHGNLKVDLQNNFTIGENRYPKNRQQTLHLLDKYSKTVVMPKMTPSEGVWSFVQKGGRGNGKGAGRGNGAEKGKGKLSIRNIGRRTRNALLSATRRGIHRRTARMQMTTKTTSPVPAKHEA